MNRLKAVLFIVYWTTSGIALAIHFKRNGHGHMLMLLGLFYGAAVWPLWGLDSLLGWMVE